jgi:hypothetical protein
METNRRSFIGATIGLIGGIAFKIPEPPIIDESPIEPSDAEQTYRGIVHTDIGDVTVPIKSIIQVRRSN